MEERRNQDQNRQPQQSQQNQPQQAQGQRGQAQQQQGQGQQAQGRQQGQQGGASASGQQQQFDMQSGQQGGQQSGSGGETRFADQIREHMEVIDANGRHCGTVDHCEDGQIKLTRSDSPTGHHEYVPLNQVAGIEGNKVRLRERGDNDFGMEAGN